MAALGGLVSGDTDNGSRILSEDDILLLFPRLYKETSRGIFCSCPHKHLIHLPSEAFRLCITECSGSAQQKVQALDLQ